MSAESAGFQEGFGQFEDLGMLASQLDEEVVVLFDEHLDDGGQLIDEDYELTHPQLVDYANYLAAVLNGGHADDDAKIAAYHAIHFALLTASQLVPGEAVMKFGDYYDVADFAALQEKIHQDTQEYMSQKPELDRLLGYYMPQIDPIGEHGYLAETVAALVFLHVDQHARDQFIDAEVAVHATTIPDSLEGLL